jgi:hypothetical protein
MKFTTATHRQNRQIITMVDNLSKATGVERSVVLHFLYTDLERIYQNKIQVHKAELKIIETEFTELNRKEQQLIQAINKKTVDTSESQKRIAELTIALEQKTKFYSEIQIQLVELRKKISELNMNISVLDKEKSQIEYNVMMKNHFIKEKTSISSKTIGWILTVFTFIAVIIAIFLILNKNK